MTLELDHTIVPARDKEKAAQFFAHIFGLAYEGLDPPFAPVRVNDRLTLDFIDDDSVPVQHYAFKVSEPEFDDIFGRVQADGLRYGSGPYRLDDMRINHRNGGRGVYFRDPDGHILEILTR